MSQLSLTFLGAAGTVTGSKHLLAIGDRRVLVDCGLFQGLKELRLRNWAPLPVDLSSIDAAGAVRPNDAAGAELRVGPEAPTLEFINAGHLLGSAYARVRIGDRSIPFGADLGHYGRPVLPDPSSVSVDCCGELTVTIGSL
jgi:Cft2 family RNA processing exonuclease